MPERTFVARPAAAEVPSWVREHYELVDAAAVDEYVLDFDPDVELRFASEPPVRGRAAVRDALAAGHARHRLDHKIVGCWEAGDETIVEFDVVYTYPDGRRCERSSVAILRRGPSGLIDSLRVYVERPPAG